MKRQLKFKDPRYLLYLKRDAPWKEDGESMKAVKAAASRMFKPIKRNAK